MPGEPAWIVASGADAVGGIVGTAAAAAFWLALAFRSIKLREEGSAQYVGLYRWTGEQVRTRPRAVAFVVAWGLAVSVVSILIAG